MTEGDEFDIDFDEIFGDVDAEIDKHAKTARQRYVEALERDANRDPWMPERRILYMHRTRCTSCGEVHDMPNNRILTEFFHSKDGRRKHCHESIGHEYLPLEVEYLPANTCPACPICLQHDEKGENDES